MTNQQTELGTEFRNITWWILEERMNEQSDYRRKMFQNLRAKYGLTVICQTPKEGDNAPSTLRVKT